MGRSSRDYTLSGIDPSKVPPVHGHQEASTKETPVSIKHSLARARHRTDQCLLGLHALTDVKADMNICESVEPGRLSVINNLPAL